MFYEDVQLVWGDTVSGLAKAYGYQVYQWKKIWDDPANATLIARREKPEKLQVGDVVKVPIPWSVTSLGLVTQSDGAEITIDRDGEAGTQLSWVQTVYRHNQPIGPNPDPFCVDACTPDDDLPFYWTNTEIASDSNRRKQFYDRPSRNRPSETLGTTKWRAVTSLAVVTGKRVTIWDSWVWGFDLPPADPCTMIGPREATDDEVRGHLRLLKDGYGTGVETFGKQGWIFRKAS
jgi:hypothetical protein